MVNWQNCTENKKVPFNLSTFIIWKPSKEGNPYEQVLCCLHGCLQMWYLLSMAVGAGMSAEAGENCTHAGAKSYFAFINPEISKQQIIILDVAVFE